MRTRAPIQVLPPGVAERIAAGEVIERPSSVVKELVENCIDAGATEIAVILEDGGKSLIEVMDNGHGMSAEDLQTCILRHATSKLTSLDDLDRIRTLGFRGEALPSVAAVSELSILSRPANAPTGAGDGADDIAGDSATAYELIADGSGRRAERVTFGHFLGSPHGTQIRARGLFSQIPARLKFLKAQASEVSQVREWLERIALAKPEVGFKLISNDRTVLTLRPEDLASRVRAVLADGGDHPLISAETAGPLKVSAYWLQGFSSPQSRKLVQIVNGRAVRDKLLQSALMSGFKQSLLPGQYPAVALFVEADPATLDVNVHPTKTEIRFLDSSATFRAIQSLIEAMIVKHGAPAFARSETPPTTSSFWELRSSTGSAPPASWPAPWRASESTGESPSSPTDDPAAPQGGALSNPLPRQAFKGTLFSTYFMYDLGEELALVDQHAAHERIRYETLKKRVLAGEETPHQQELLLPEAVSFDVENRPLLEQRLALLKKLGFDAEIFGDESLLFRAVPAGWGSFALRTRLKSLVERVLLLELAPGDTQALRLDESLFEKIASEACHSAIRAGDRVDDSVALAITDQLFACEHPWNCPHGRPTVVRVPRARLEEWFQRRV